MHEWDLQHYLTKLWRKEYLLYNNSKYHLVCWELMFPSWQINDNRGKWNEVSIDFILYSEELAEFLCVELKNHIKGNKDLLSAYRQATQRTIHFTKQYDTEKLKKAREICHKSPMNGRGVSLTADDISYSSNPSIKRILMANSFQSNASGRIDYFNRLNRKELQNEYSKYSLNNKEFERFNAVKEEEFHLISNHPLSLIDLGNIEI